jgi:uncharacterized protein
MKVFIEPLSFDWDNGNINKNYDKHLITHKTAEEPFTDADLLTFPDPTHSTSREKRFSIIGQTHQNDTLFITYTIRHNKIRIISARIANKNERKIYESQKI